MEIVRPAAAAFLAACAVACAPEGAAEASDEAWRSMFDGETLNGWTVKVASRPLGEDPLETFRVRDGALVISYDNYEALDGQFAHIFYETPFSYYRLRLDYRFVGEQISDGPEWAKLNNGIMIHAQPPETMGVDQDFPVSIEVQLLGGDGVMTRTTGNICTPGTSIVINGERDHEHCIYSERPATVGDQWTTAEIEVRGGERIRHFINGEQVMDYSEPLLDEPQSWSAGLELVSGYIALQAESHPTEFRNIEILVIEE